MPRLVVVALNVAVNVREPDGLLGIYHALIDCLPTAQLWAASAFAVVGVLSLTFDRETPDESKVAEPTMPSPAVTPVSVTAIVVPVPDASA